MPETDTRISGRPSDSGDTDDCVPCRFLMGNGICTNPLLVGTCQSGSQTIRMLVPCYLSGSARLMRSCAFYRPLKARWMAEPNKIPRNNDDKNM